MMRQKFEAIKENLFEFADQDDYPMLVVRCKGDELAYVLTFFQALEQTREADYVLAFAQPFPSAQGYLNGVMDSVCLQVEAAAQLREEQPEAEIPELPPVPDELLDQQMPPEQRLFGLLMYLRGLLPNEQDHRLILGFLPLEVQDWQAFVELMRRVMPVEEVPPWMTTMRIVTWDDRDQRLLTRQIDATATDLLLSFEVDLSPEALTDQLTRDAANPTVPVAERMACLMHEELCEKYEYHFRWGTVLERQVQIYKGARMRDQAQEAMGRLDAVRLLEHVGARQ